MALNPNACVDGVMNGFSLHIEPPRIIGTKIIHHSYFINAISEYRGMQRGKCETKFEETIFDNNPSI